MAPMVFGLILVSALLHVAWNVLLKTAEDPLRTAGRAAAVAVAVGLPVAAVAWLGAGRPVPSAAAVGLAAVSAGLEVAYFVLLSAAYRRGDLSVVYPIARGTAPILAVGAGVLILGERLGPVGLAGVGALLVGIVAIRRPWDVARTGSPAVPFALATGVAIAAYSAVDRVGTQLVAPWLYAALLWSFTAAGLAGWIAITTRLGRLGGRDGPALPWRRAAAIGGLMVTAHLLVLGALSLESLSTVAPLRESAVVLAGAWGVTGLREGHGPVDVALRLGGAGLILAGAILLAVGA